MARHPQRPHFSDFINTLVTEFTPMAGDRKFAEDEALVGGFGRFRGESICVVGQEKGATTESRIKHNFGMARPEGYRKAVRLMEMADRFGIPVLSIVDSAGAYPGIGAEERGQAEAIARSTDACLSLGVPNVAIITGEGMSGGAIAITTANRVLMFEHAIYSVISPEAASSILWRDGTKAQEAATSMKITAQDMLRFGVIDQILKEPPGGAHRDAAAMITATGDAIAQAFDDLRNLDADGVRRQRRQKFLDIGRKLGLKSPDFSPNHRIRPQFSPEPGLYGLLTMPDMEPAGTACSGCDKRGQRVRFYTSASGHDAVVGVRKLPDGCGA